MSDIIYFSTSDYDEYKLLQEHREIFGDDATIIKGSKKHLRAAKAMSAAQLDVESTMTDFITNRIITVVQLGDYDGDFQYIFDIPRLSTAELIVLKEILSSQMVFYIHNAMFEYTAIKQMWGIDIQNIKDTYVQAKLLTNGLTLRPGYNSLAGIVYREFSVELDKGSQTSFDGSELSYEQVIYAALDVVFLIPIYNIYADDIKYWGLSKVFALECKALRSVGDMHVNGILFDMDYHLKHTVSKFKSKYKEEKKAMIDTMISVPKVVTFLKDSKMMQATDEYLFKWTSPKVNKQVLGLLYPGLNTSNKTTIKKLLKDEDLDISMKGRMVLNNYIASNTAEVEKYLISNHHDDLVDMGLFVAADTILINFDSPAQRLKLFNFWYPDLKDTNSKTLARLVKGVLPDYKKYIKSAKMLSSFGEKMENYIESDARIHPSFTLMVSTGRMSSSKPNGQNQPSTSEYRNAYYAREGFSFVGADYSSQEILVAAQASGDKEFWHAIKNGYDLHSYSASKIYGKPAWLEAGGHWPPVGKPKTKEANKLRKASKSLSFSLFYGSSARSLSENLGIPHKEAQELMERYYETFPELAKYFKKQNRFGQDKKYSRGLPPFNRVRFYDVPRNAGDANSIGRKSQNAGIQGTSADMTKLAMIYIKQYIDKHALQNKVFITLQVHDEIICEVHKSIVVKWAKIQSKLMEKAADVIIPGGWLKADAEIMERWNK